MMLSPDGTTAHALNISLGPLTITGFGIAVAAAFILGQMIASREMERRGFSSDPVADIVAATLIGFIVGAKIYYAVLTHSFDSIFTRGGFVFWGGFTGSVIAGALVIRKKKLRFWHIADVFCIGLAGGYSVGRTGCWAVGDDYGKPWPGGWLAVKFPEGVPTSTAGNMMSNFGVHFPPGTDPRSVIAVYPTQLLEVFLGFLIFLIVWRLREHKHAEGWLFGVWAVWAGIERFLVEFLRAKDDHIAGPGVGLSAAQVISIGIFLFGIVWMRMRNDVTADHPGIRATWDFTGRVAIVTGAARGLGRAAAERLYELGASVAVNVRDIDRAEEVANSLGERALAIPGDIAATGKPDDIARRVMDRFGRIDILVNNAAMAETTRFPDLTADEWRETIEVNLTAPFLMTKAVLSAMQAQNYGRVINISSSAGRMVSTLGGAHYTASKTGLLGLTRAAAKELGKFGITVNAVCPGMIDTELTRESASTDLLERLAAGYPVPRLGTAREVADLICFAASEAAGYITGAAFDINGGDLMM